MSTQHATVPLKAGAEYQPASAYDTQTLKVSDVHTIYFWQAGNPEGKPVVFLHGGPGSGTGLKDTVYFNPKEYRIVLIDQRGAGKSEPSGDIRENTTWDLVADIERVREKLDINKWLVFGGSWGSTLSLAYAETHPDRTAALIIRGVFLSTRRELDWTYRDGGANNICPQAWDLFINDIPVEERDDIMGAYYRRMCDSDPAVSLPAARRWSVFEDSTAKLIPDPDLIARSEDDKFALAIGRIEAHYFVNYGFMPDGHLTSEEQISKVRDIPCVVVQGRYDTMSAAWKLKKAWGEQLRLYCVADAGHSAHEPGTKKLLVGAADEFAATLNW